MGNKKPAIQSNPRLQIGCRRSPSGKHPTVATSGRCSRRFRATIVGYPLTEMPRQAAIWFGAKQPATKNQPVGTVSRPVGTVSRPVGMQFAAVVNCLRAVGKRCGIVGKHRRIVGKHRCVVGKPRHIVGNGCRNAGKCRRPVRQLLRRVGSTLAAVISALGIGLLHPGRIFPAKSPFRPTFFTPSR